MSCSSKKLLLHLCCAPCGGYVAQLLAQKYQITLFFFNPNIYPQKEYEIRLREAQHYAKKINYDLLVGNDDYQWWRGQIRGLEDKKEGGERCWRCYELRLEETAKLAAKQDFDSFTTTLSISPHKKAQKINEIGTAVVEKYKVDFLAADFKKQDGFKKACDLSKTEGFYRQRYCGCEFSFNDFLRNRQVSLEYPKWP